MVRSVFRKWYDCTKPPSATVPDHVDLLRLWLAVPNAFCLSLLLRSRAAMVTESQISTVSSAVIRTNTCQWIYDDPFYAESEAESGEHC